MSHLLAMFIFVFSATAYSQDYDVDDIFSGNVEDFQFTKFDNNDLLLTIAQDAKVACNKKGICTLNAVTSYDRRYTVQFQVGQGNPNYNNSGTGTTVIIPGNGGGLGSNEPYFGLLLKYTNGKCTQEVQVPRSLYFAMNIYMYNLMTDEAGPKKGFTPADEAMIMFYTTIMKQASGCVAAN